MSSNVYVTCFLALALARVVLLHEKDYGLHRRRARSHSVRVRVHQHLGKRDINNLINCFLYVRMKLKAGDPVKPFSYGGIHVSMWYVREIYACDKLGGKTLNIIW